MTNKTFNVAIVQLCSGLDIQKNIGAAEKLVRQAAARGADYIQTPETTTLMELEAGKAFALLEPKQGNSHVQHFSDLAKELGVWLHIGSMGIRLECGRMANRSFLFQPDGRVSDVYDKMHMFDVDLPGGEQYRESQDFRPGEKAVLAQTPWGGLGMSICYDLRFPALYRFLGQNGASFLAVPSAFTKVTGQAHWHILLRARAIETGCFVFAAAQGGRHENGRDTFGHSLIIDPWGKILAEAGTEPTVIMATIDPGQVKKVREQIPSLKHGCRLSL